MLGAFTDTISSNEHNSYRSEWLHNLFKVTQHKNGKASPYLILFGFNIHILCPLSTSLPLEIELIVRNSVQFTSTCIYVNISINNLQWAKLLLKSLLAKNGNMRFSQILIENIFIEQLRETVNLYTFYILLCIDLIQVVQNLYIDDSDIFFNRPADKQTLCFQCLHLSLELLLDC